MQHLGVGFVREFAGTVEGTSWEQQPADNRSDMNQQAGALRAEVRQNRPAYSNRSQEVHIQLMRRLRLGVAFGQADRHQAAIVDHDIDARSLA
jgi:hypothetical protein